MTEFRFRSPADALGFTLLPNAVLLCDWLSPAEKLLYALLRHYARQRDHCWPGQLTLAARLKVSQRHVRTLTRSLSSVGLISIQQRGERRTNLCWIEEITPALLATLVPDRNCSSGLDRNYSSGPMEEDSA